MKQLLYQSFSRLRGDRVLWGLSASRLRILCYHGVCDDAVAGESWVPDYFVSESAFESQLQYLQRHATVIPLQEAVTRLGKGTLPERSVSLTFDDGYANNLDLAYRLLRKYRMHATIFLSSAYVESGELYPFLKLRLLKRDKDFGRGPRPEYKSEPLDKVMGWIGDRWPFLEKSLTEQERRTLRPMTVQEVKTADSEFLDFGAHTDTHCILKNETQSRRQQEIRSSIAKVAQWTGRPVTLFSYPNGQQGDFGETDKVVLRAEGIQAAVAGVKGWNDHRSDRLELKRYPVGIYHDGPSFCAEVTGFRSAILAGRKRVS